MILSHTHKFICLNPPKTGSGFRENLLKEFTDISVLTTNDHILRHYNVDQAVQYVQDIGKHPDDYFWCTFTRNPWRRIISWCNMIVNQKLKGDEYVREPLMIDSNLLESVVKNFPGQDPYLTRDGKLLDFIGSLENITEDMSRVSTTLSLNLSIPSHKDHHKVDAKSQLTSSWTPEMIDIITRKNQLAIELKNYHFK